MSLKESAKLDTDPYLQMKLNPYSRKNCKIRIRSIATSDLQTVLSQFTVRYKSKRKIDTTRGGVEDTRVEAKAKHSKKFRGQGQTFSRPRPRTKDTDPSVLQKKGLQKFFFRRSLLDKTEKRSLQIFREVFGVFQQNFNGSKIVLSSSREQGNFRGLEASRPRLRTSKCVL